MKNRNSTRLIAVVGGSGAGKTWFARRLCEEFADEAAPVALDDFYCDLSYLMLSERERINFDHPDTIDWPLFETTLRDLRGGDTVTLPRYDFTTHNRLPIGEVAAPRSLMVVEGLWLLWHPHIRELFDVKIFLDCSQTLRWERRLARDLKERQRNADSVCERFWNVVAPMHQRYVECQKAWADMIIPQPTSAVGFAEVVKAVRAIKTSRSMLQMEPPSSRSLKAAKLNSL